MGGGGPAKAADPKVTPFVDYSAQTPAIPNWFANRTAQQAAFTPDFSQSQTALSTPAQQPVQQVMPATALMPAPATVNDMASGSISPHNNHGLSRFSIPTQPLGGGYMGASYQAPGIDWQPPHGGTMAGGPQFHEFTPPQPSSPYGQQIPSPFDQQPNMRGLFSQFPQPQAVISPDMNDGYYRFHMNGGQ